MTEVAPDPGADPRLRVFLSYSRADVGRVRPLVEALSRAGVETWWDDHIPGGAAYAREIQAALADADAVVVVWSETSVNSDWVRDEAATGRDQGRLVPVRIDPVAPPLGFGQYQVVDLCGWSGRPEDPAFQRLVHAVRRIGGHSVARPVAAVARPGGFDLRVLSRRRLMVGAAAVGGVTAVAAGGWMLLHRNAPAHSIAVLPFANLTGDPSQDLVGDGLAEEVRSALASVSALQVISRTSSELFRGARAGSAGIAARLGVAYLLEGVVQKSAGTLRIGARLVRGADGFEQWTESFDRPADNLLALESDIANRVAGALRVKLLGDDAILPGGTRSDPAYQLYLRARRLYDVGGDEESLRESVTLFEQALAVDPRYADAKACLARSLIAIADQFVSGATRTTLFKQGLAAAEAAVRLAPESAEAQAALGFARMGRLDVRGAREPYERAGALGAGDANRLVGYGGYEVRIGQFDLALPALRRAVVLDPLNPNAHLTLGDALFLARRPSEAVASLDQALSLSPKMVYVRSRRGDCRLAAGDAAGALAEYQAEPALLYRETGLAIALQRLGRTAEADAALRRLVEGTGDNGLYQQAQVQAQWGRVGAALEALERGLAVRDAGLTRIKVDPALDPVRREPRFTRLLSTLGFD